MPAARPAATCSPSPRAWPPWRSRSCAAATWLPRRARGQGTPLALSVNPADTTIEATSAVNPASFGAQVQLQAVVRPVAPGAGTPSGVLTYTIDGLSQAMVATAAARTHVDPQIGLCVIARQYAARGGRSSRSQAVAASDHSSGRAMPRARSCFHLCLELQRVG